MQSMGSIPEPPPVNRGQPIYHIVLQYLERVTADEKTKTEVSRLLQDRYTFGLNKYGQPLMSEDGRNDVEDCIQEIGDAIQYIVKAKYNGKDISSIKRALAVLNQIAEME